MKNNLFYLISFLFLYANTNSSAQVAPEKKQDSLSVVHVVGVAVEKEIPIDGAIIRLFKENEELEWDEITSVAYHDHDFAFDLLLNSYYTIEVSKPGYISRSIVILTSIPDSKNILEDKYHFQFIVELFKEKKGVDDFYLDFPVALIKYDKKRDQFEMNLNYTNHIKNKIEETTKIKSTKSVKN
jgi:hypothetical protein